MKCSNCGAEIKMGSKYCDFCGAAISSDMIREQEIFRKEGCPKCGSTNISFEREKQGEMYGKKGTAIIRATVGVCKDCGYTWRTNITNEMPKKRRTWLWVLGWLCMFPIPLTILLLRKKDLNPIVKFGIIAIAWVAFFALGLSGNKSKTTQPSSSTVVESSVQQESNADTFDVTLDVAPNVNADDGSVLFSVSTNLPENTELMVTVKNEEGYTAQDKAVVLSNGVANTAEFSNQGEALSGKYIVTISMSLPELQDESVRKVIGEKGEKISGEYVEHSDLGDANIVSADFEFEF